MQHKVPKISEVNLELIDPNFYFDTEPSNENITVSLSTKCAFKDNVIVFFIHVRYILNDNKTKEGSVFHTDYLSLIECEKVKWKNKNEIEIDKTFLSHLFGMSFLMVRGAISNRLASNVLSSIEIPTINPKLILEESLDSIENKFKLTKELEGHTSKKPAGNIR